MDAFGSLLFQLLVASGVAVVVWALFRRVDGIADPQLREQTRRWLARDTATPPSDWARNLSEFFDRLFGEELHSRRALLGSCLLSFVSMLGLLALFLALDLPSVKTIAGLDLAAHGAVSTVIGGAVFVAMMNFVPDYVSLIESRAVVRWMAGTPNAWARLGMIVLDGALTFFTLFAFMFCFTFLGWALEGGFSQALAEYPSFVSDFWWAIGPSSEHPVQLCFYSTFSTSLVIWLYSLGGFAVRSLATRAPRNRLSRMLFAGGRPIRAIGATASLIAFVAILIVCWLVAPPGALALR